MVPDESRFRRHHGSVTQELEQIRDVGSEIAMPHLQGRFPSVAGVQADVADSVKHNDFITDFSRIRFEDIRGLPVRTGWGQKAFRAEHWLHLLGNQPRPGVHKLR